jgi:hypothetical protein
MIGENFFRHDVGRKTSADREGVRRDGSPGFLISFIAVRTEGHDVTGNDIAAGNAQPAADGLKHDDQVGIQAAVTSHENTEIVTQRGFAFGVRLGDLINLIKIKFADFERGADIKIFKQGFDLFKARCVIFHVIFIDPAFFQNDGDHGFEQQGVRAGANPQMDIRDLRGF